MSTSIQTTEGIVKKVVPGAVQLDKMYKSDYQKDKTQTVQLRQEVTVTSIYPSTQPKTGGLFDVADFGIEGKEYTSKEERVAWIDVPETATAEQVQERLDKLPNKGIMKILSNRPILSANQKNAISRGIAELDTFAEKQIVRYPEGHEKAGQLILDPNGKVQYKVNNFEPVMKEHVMDLRNADPNDYYVSEEIAEELMAVIETEQRF